MRTSTDALDVVLRDLLASHLAVASASDSRLRYSLRIIDETEAAPGTRPIHQLYRRGCLEVRARTPLRAVRGLLTHLAHEVAAGRHDLVEVRGLVLVGDGGAIIAPAAVRRDLQRVERRLWDRDVVAADAPAALLDAHTGEIVVVPPLASIDEQTRARVGALAPPAPGEPVVPAGSYPVVGWILAGEAPRSRADATARVIGRLVDRARRGPALAAIARAMAEAHVTTLDGPRSLPQRVSPLLPKRATRRVGEPVT